MTHFLDIGRTRNRQKLRIYDGLAMSVLPMGKHLRRGYFNPLLTGLVVDGCRSFWSGESGARIECCFLTEVNVFGLFYQFNIDFGAVSYLLTGKCLANAHFIPVQST